MPGILFLPRLPIKGSIVSTILSFNGLSKASTGIPMAPPRPNDFKPLVALERND
jgi:hypothetical protein